MKSENSYDRKEVKKMRSKLKEARQKAGMTQQQMADYLHIGLRHYQRIEAGVSHGTYVLWDTLEDLTGVHQRILRETSSSHPDLEDSQ